MHWGKLLGNIVGSTLVGAGVGYQAVPTWQGAAGGAALALVANLAALFQHPPHVTPS